MTKEVKEILCKAISDCGYWMWWDLSEGCAQAEFGGVLLYDEAKEEKEPRSGHIAIRFWIMHLLHSSITVLRRICRKTGMTDCIMTSWNLSHWILMSLNSMMPNTQ